MSHRRLRIGISALHRASGGSLTNLVQLLSSWKSDGTLDGHEWVIFASEESASALRTALGDLGPSVSTVVLSGAGGGLLRRLVDEQLRLPLAVRRLRIDVLFCPGNVMPYLTRTPVVAAFQNAAPFCESVTAKSVGLRPWLQFALLGRLMRLTARRARRVIFISRFFRDLFVERFGFRPERGRVVPRAGGAATIVPADPALEARLELRRPFILSVSHLNPYKNTVELIEGFAAATADRPEWQLVLVGMANFPAYLERIQAAIATHRVHDRVRLTGELAHHDARALMAACEVFVFTSTCENCPTALIEALSAGAAVASSDVGVMPEITGDAALLFDPDRPADIGAALGRLLSDTKLREDLRIRARQRAASFAVPPAVARDTFETIEDAFAAGGRGVL